MPMTVDTVDGQPIEARSEAGADTPGRAPGDGRQADAAAGRTPSDARRGEAIVPVRLITQMRNPFSEKVARALALKKVEFDRVIVSEPDEIAHYSPETRELPVLEIDGERRAGSGAILYWIDERYPEPPLLSSDAKVADAQRSLAEWSDSSFAWYWNRWLVSQAPADGDGSPVPDASFLGRMRSGLGLGARPARPDALQLQVIDGIERRLDDLAALLGGRDYFHASQPSMADLAVLGMLLLIAHGPIPRSGEMLAARPTLVAYMRRLEDATGGPYVVAA